jgi:succinyl-CoA synthetase beta subunit
MLDESTSYSLLKRVGVPTVASVSLSLDDLLAERTVDLPFSYPVAVKVLSSRIAHKSRIGGVVLGIESVSGLWEAGRSIDAAARSQRIRTAVTRVLVQPMVHGVGEMLVGYRVDPEAGPCVILAAGGSLTEVLRDRSIRMAPVDFAAAKEMLREVGAVRALLGLRGAAAADLQALTHAVVGISRLGDLDDPIVVEAEVNPLVVGRQGEGVMAVDAVVRVARRQSA